MTSKLEYVGNEVRRIITLNCADNRMEHVFSLDRLNDIYFNGTSGRHEIECFFGIDFEQEQVDAWTTVQNIIDDVMNLWVAPISTAAERAATVGESGPELIMHRRYAPIGQGANPETVAKLTKDMISSPRVHVEPKINIDRAQVAAINRIERRDVEQFKEFKDIDEGMGVPNTLDHYQSIATKSAIYPGKGTPFGLMYAALGLAEAGEVQNKVKKAFRDDGLLVPVNSDGSAPGIMEAAAPLTPERRAQIIKELGGVLWYIAAVCDEIGATMSEVALTNLDELCGRGERNTLRGDGDDR